MDVVGRIVTFEEHERRVPSSGDVKNILVLTLTDESVNINVTFWDHIDVIKGIEAEALNKKPSY